MRYFNPTKSVAEPLIKASKVFALDTETRGLLRRDEIVMLIVATKKDSFVWDTRKGRWPSWLNPYLSSPKYVKVIHNALFDDSLIQTQQEVRVKNVRDTMLQEKILLGIEAPFNNKDESIKEKYSTSLKYTLKRHNLKGKEGYDSRGFKTHEGPFTKEQLDYAHGDVQELIELNHRQEVEARDFNLLKVFELENAAVEVFTQMRVRGIGFNRDLWLQIADGYTEEFNEHKRIFDTMLKKEARAYNKVKHYKEVDVPIKDVIDRDGFGSKSVKTIYKKVKQEIKSVMPEEINVNSPMQVKKLFGLRGILIESYTDFKRQYSLNKVEYNDKLLDAFFDMREFYQLSNTFGAKWLKEDTSNPTVDQVDLRVHPNFTQIISTGRSSCSDPNLQQLPGYAAYEMGGGHPRDAFVAAKGYTMFGADYKGQEFALMMLLANETKWLEYIRLGYDTHSMLSEMAQPGKWLKFTEPGCEFAKSKRQCSCKEHKQLRTYTKKIIFGKPYGKGITSIAEDLSIPYLEARPLVRAIERVLPKTMRWMEVCKQQALDDKAVWTLPPFNRYRKLEFFVAPKSRFSVKKGVDDEAKEADISDYFKTKGASKDSWRRKMIADNSDWRVKNQGVNSPIQGSGADMLKSAMVKLQKYIDDNNFPAYLLLPVHDAIMSECKDSHAKRWKKVLNDLMEEAAMEITQGINLIKVDIKEGKSWK